MVEDINYEEITRDLADAIKKQHTNHMRKQIELETEILRLRIKLIRAENNNLPKSILDKLDFVEKYVDDCWEDYLCTLK